MAHTSTKITKPVRLTQDLQPFFGRGGGLAALTVAVTGLSTFNKWSKHKPFYHPSTGPLSESDRVGTTAQIQSGYYYGVKFAVSDMRYLISDTSIFDYLKVQSGHYARSLDYDGYNSAVSPNLKVSGLASSHQFSYYGSSSYSFRIEYDKNHTNTDGIDYRVIVGDETTLGNSYAVFIIKVGSNYYGSACRYAYDHSIQKLNHHSWAPEYEVDLSKVPGISKSATPVPYVISIGITKTLPSEFQSNEWVNITNDYPAIAIYGGIQFTVNVSQQQSIIPKATAISYSLSGDYLTYTVRLSAAASKTLYMTVGTIIHLPSGVDDTVPYPSPGYIVISQGQQQFTTGRIYLDPYLYSGLTVDIEWNFRVSEIVPPAAVGETTSGVFSNVVIP